jgi:UTP--glucose-1-phosphate uridylyltransferase
MRADGASEPQLAAFARRLEQLEQPEAGLLPGDALEPLGDIDALDALPEAPGGALERVAIVKLNGGLGTSMGLSAPKSTIVAKDDRSFLDVIARQVLALRERTGARLPLVLMDSPHTRAPTLRALRLPAADVPADFLQGREPKLRADDHEPVRWPADPELEWCPPGHGELYVALAGSGMLQTLLDAGYELAFTSNADNLGAVADPRIAAWMAAERVPFAMEVVQGTQADRKGGHLARHDGRIVLRETAQVPDGDASFGDVERWRWYNTNNLWIDLRALAVLLDRDPAGPELPLIVNRKTVDPTDPQSPPVLQLENAMGAAIGAIDGARPLHVSRARFRPGQDHRRSARAALRRLRAGRRRDPAPDVRRRPARRDARRALQAAGRLRGALPRPPAVPARRDPVHGMSVVAFAPGRVNLIGEHTDYNGGLALPFAIADGVTVTATPRDDGQILARALDLGEEDRFDAADPPGGDGWRAFVRGTVGELGRAGLAVAPATLEITGTVAQGSGLSSSAALEVALALALIAVGGDEPPEALALARLCARVENDWVGAHTGLLDQIASLVGRRDTALRIDFATLAVDPVPLRTGDWTLVTVDSREPHSHAAGGYNARREECVRACELLGVDALAAAGRDAAAQLPDPLDRRARHVLDEDARVEAAIAALRDDDLAELGRLLSASHASLRDLYDASTEKVEQTVQALLDAGAAGARMVGGGFGGHVLALLPPGVEVPAEATVVAPSPGATLR